MRNHKAFTLIELLIVVAIIAILAAIAVPNFLEAQTRAKVSRVKADMRTLATALEAYAVDNNRYPPGSLGDRISRVSHLSTPIAYITNPALDDPFSPSDPTIDNDEGTFLYYNYQSEGMYNSGRSDLGSFITQIFQTYGSAENAPRMFLVHSLGPDRSFDAPVLIPFNFEQDDTDSIVDRYYDPTNGTISGGDITRFGGEVPSFPTPSD